MLTTRCPDCETVFRITADALHKADGQVRCGQCATVFSAFDSLTDTMTDLPTTAVTETFSNISDKLSGDGSLRRQVAMPESPDDERTDPDAADPITEAEVDEVLEAGESVPPLPWTLIDPPRSRLESPVWASAAVLAVAFLIGQAVHHFRSDVSQMPFIGPGLSQVYALAGSPIKPAWNPADFNIVDWVATASSTDSDVASLEISASIRNQAGESRPYPLLFLRLTDRWEKPIGSRIFEPSDYLSNSPASSARMRPGATVNAALELVDPGPNAYGFEVDVCVGVNADMMRCKSDIVFE